MFIVFVRPYRDRHSQLPRERVDCVVGEDRLECFVLLRCDFHEVQRSLFALGQLGLPVVHGLRHMPQTCGRSSCAYVLGIAEGARIMLTIRPFLRPTQHAGTGHQEQQ